VKDQKEQAASIRRKQAYHTTHQCQATAFSLTGLDPILGVGEEMLAEPRADAHDDDSMGVVFSVRDHEESHPARSR
jgi:hypothetical protein